MKLLTITSCFLLVGICQAAARYSRNAADDEIAKRELHEGNFGMKIKPSTLESTTSRQGTDDKNDLSEDRPEIEEGSPRETIPKISDALLGLGPSFPAAIESHLNSPVQVYQPRLGTPTTLEISHPMASQFSFSKHNNIFQPTEDIQFLNNNLQLFPSIGVTQQVSAQLSSLPAITQSTTPQTTIPNELLPSLKISNFQPLPELSQIIHRQLSSTYSDMDPRDMYQQINQLQSLSDKIPYEKDNIQLIENDDVENSKQQREQQAEINYAKQLDELNLESVEQENTDQKISLTTQIPNTTQPQYSGYARFSPSIPFPEQVKSFTLPPREQQLPQAQSPPQFQPISAQVTDQPVTTTRSTPSELFTVTTQTPRRIGIIRFRQKLTTPLSQDLSSKEPQASSTSSYLTTATSRFLPYSNEPITTTFSTVVPHPHSQHHNYQASRIKTQRKFPLRSKLPPISERPLQTLSTLPIFFTQTQSAATQTITSSPPRHTSTTLRPTRSQPELIQSTLISTPLDYESTKTYSLQPENTTPTNLLQLTTLRALPTFKPLPSSTTLVPQQQTSQILSEPQPNSQIQDPGEKSQPLEPQVTVVQKPMQVKQQFQEIGQNLQLISQQPELLQQQQVELPIETSQNQLLSIQIPHQPLPPIILQQQESIQTIPQQLELVEHTHEILHPSPLVQSLLPFFEQPQLIQQDLHQPQYHSSQLSQYTNQVQLSSQTPTENHNKSLSDHQPNQHKLQDDNSKKYSTVSISQENKPEDFYNQFLRNNLYSENQELYYLNTPYLPVPVGISSFPDVDSVPVSQVIPSYQGHVYHNVPTALSAVQYYGKYAPNIFRNWH